MLKSSKLSDHKLIKGKFFTPINLAMGELLKENPWFQGRLPEYLWLGLILEYYGRSEGLERCYFLLKKVSEYKSLMETLKFSDMLNLSQNTQVDIYQYFLKLIDKEALSPLTAIFTYTEYPIFSNCFVTELSLNERVERINKVFEKTCNHQSEMSTDIRFLIIYYQLLIDKLYFVNKSTLDLLLKYPKLPHDNEEMRMIRPLIRSMEVGNLDDKNISYLNTFWKRVSDLNECELYAIEISNDHKNSEEYISQIKEILCYYNKLFTSTRPLDNKMLVILGIATYSYKRLLEVVEHNLYQTITGRSVVRILIENYIMLKYLLLNESSHKDIWTEYQYYGIGQYKLIAERYKESKNKPSNSHVMYDYMDFLVGEYKDKEFIDMDTNYFNRTNIRIKADTIGEKELYGLFYDYDSAFEHGLWGAIRESSLIKCNSPSHQYHCVPDVENIQKMPDVWHDCKIMMDKIVGVLKELYGLPPYFEGVK